MSSLNLIKLIQDYLDAEILLDRSKSAGTESETHAQRLLHMRNRLENYIDTAPADVRVQTLGQRVIAYLAAVDAFDAARATGGDVSSTSRRLYVADGDLQEALYLSVRWAATQPDRAACRILVAIKDEPASDRALYTAVHMAERAATQLKLLHVLTGTEQSGVTPPFGGLDVSYAWRSAANFLARKRNELPAGMECETLVRQGEPAQEIVSAARRWGADFIVMGLHGVGRAAMHGSADRVQAVLPRATCPVIVVGQSAHAAMSADWHAEETADLLRA
ncbi:MAG: universal stress protein [Tepidisphaeraceae bacterium]